MFPHLNICSADSQKHIILNSGTVKFLDKSLNPYAYTIHFRPYRVVLQAHSYGHSDFVFVDLLVNVQFQDEIAGNQINEKYTEVEIIHNFTSLNKCRELVGSTPFFSPSSATFNFL